MAIGGALLGGLTAAITQATGVPVAVADGDDHEIDTVRKRLGWAFGIPLTGLLLLLLLVLPFAWTLIESNHLTSGGAAVIGIGTIVVFILAVLFARSPEEEAEEPAAEPEAAVVLVLG
jgi:tetrahydromethanopterin S-methyltransferase subunit E